MLTCAVDIQHLFWDRGSNIMSKITINDITMYYIFVGMLFVSLVLSTNGSKEREEKRYT